MVQLNLLPDVKKEFIKAQRVKNTVIGVAILVTIGSLALTILLAAIVYLVQPGLITLTQGSIDERSEQLRNVEDIDKYLTVQNQLESLPELHQGTTEYSRMFDFLKRLNPAPPNNIQLTSLRIDTELQAVTMNGSTNGFKAFSVFEDTLRNAKVTYKEVSGEQQTVQLFMDNGVVVSEQSLTNNNGTEQLSFTLEAAYNPEVFAPNNQDIKLSIPNITTSQSVTAAPSSVFQEEQ